MSSESINKFPTAIACGLSTGIFQAIIFNPYDRALYLSVENNRKFFDTRNFLSGTMKGVLPSILQRGVSFGLYFPLEGIAREIFNRFGITTGGSDSAAGLLAGGFNGLITAPLNAAKFAMWRDKDPQNIKQVVENGGVRALMRAAPATVCRDAVFGLVFSFLRHRGSNKESGFITNAAAALVATTLSSPFNYARLKQYAVPASQQPGPSMNLVFRDFIIQTNQATSKTRFVFQSFNIGWGALRVALGMGISSQLYINCQRHYQ